MSVNEIKHARLPGKLILIGFGAIGQGSLPLILRHLDVKPSDITIITADERGLEEAQEYKVNFLKQPITRENFRQILEPLISKNDFVLNLSVDVSSLALIQLCQEKGALYLDSCVEPWKGGYRDTSLTPSLRSNYALREQALDLQRKTPNSSTAVIAQGANPGLVSHFVKQALLNIAADVTGGVQKPQNREEWARLAMQLGIKVIHVAERDSQVTNVPKKPGEFVNTWSIDGFTGEGCQPAELGWGTHEIHWPKDAEEHTFGCDAAIYLNCPGASVRVRTWTPSAGPFHGFLITHNEAISIADFFTFKEGERVVYRPTAHYAYHPCDDAILSVHEFAGKNWSLQESQRLLMHEIVEGTDELGVLLMGHEKGAYWYGSELSTNEARKLAPYNNATSLQVAISVLSGMVWAIENPQAGIVEADEMDFERHLEICAPYLGKLHGKYSEWTPLDNRGVLFSEDVDQKDPWQFKNFRVL